LITVLTVGVIAYILCLPKRLFQDPYSTVLEARDGELLSAAIASDGQWRFPEQDSVPKKFADALVAFEDKRFWNHPGVDVLSFGRAMRQNISAGRVVSGGSTISMQVIRLSRKSESRTILEKVIEMILATRLEVRYSKEEILSLYASHAPFGGNVVGINAACWRYFGHDARQLSWGEATLLAVLPNAPSLIHPGKNRDRLSQKRNTLLRKLLLMGTIDAMTYSLAKDEPIPDEPMPLPQTARHLLARLSKDGNAEHRVRSTVDFSLQRRVEQIVEDHHQRLKGNQIHHAAAVVADVRTGNVLAYVGNVSIDNRHPGDEVDALTSPRSTGSILKPFLYAAMLDEGKILPATLLPDVPLYINGFSPKNFSKEYDGAVPGDRALIRSLNIPAVHLLREYRYEKFHPLLKELGMTTLNRPPDHYGLALILGGAEGTVWDITGMYASLARTLNNYFEHPGKNRYREKDSHPLSYVANPDSSAADELDESSVIGAAAIYETFDVLKELYRPGEESGWRHFSSSKRIAWKTGTSFGFRDGWAVGVTPDYVVGVWTGNADGEGRPGLTGTDAASPIMFDIFSQLPGDAWFEQPQPEMEKVEVCSRSGYRKGEWCTETEKQWIARAGLQSAPCPYHKKVNLTNDLRFRVHSNCESISRITSKEWFVLPPLQEYYFRSKNISYKPLPPLRKDCQPSLQGSSMDLIYPKANARIFIPRDLDGKPGYAVFDLAHRHPETTVFWHLDDAYIGSTKRTHQMTLHPSEGKHKLVLMDETGEILEQRFTVLSKM
jgi:penicillin-binding protein 1C